MPFAPVAVKLKVSLFVRFMMMSDFPLVVPFGTTPSGEAVSQITLGNADISCQIITYGAALRTLLVPDRDGKPVDVVLGYDTLQE